MLVAKQIKEFQKFIHTDGSNSRWYIKKKTTMPMMNALTFLAVPCNDILFSMC